MPNLFICMLTINIAFARKYLLTSSYIFNIAFLEFWLFVLKRVQSKLRDWRWQQFEVTA